VKNICVDPRTSLVWRALIAQQRGSVFHSPDWIQVLSDTYGLDVCAHVLLDDVGAPVAGMALGRVADLIGERIVSLPFSDYCDPLVGDFAQWNQLIAPLLAEGRPIIVRCLHNRLPLADDRFTQFKQAMWHGKDLHPDLDALWHALPNSTRRAIEKARRMGVTVRAANCPAELRAFFELHLKVRKYKYRLLAQPYRFFEHIWEHFLTQQRGVLLLAFHHNTIIGGTLYLESNDTLYYKFNASAMTDLAQRPNDLLAWEGIQYGKSLGCTTLDFGLSDCDQEGLLRFKRKFATEEKLIAFLHHLPPGMPSLREQQLRKLVSALTDLLTDEAVADQVSDRAGDLLYQYFT
jgi:CelD/BcsL family acetyltransferase involved in cellulose biosynthesis